MNETRSAVEWRRRILATTAFFALASVACDSQNTLFKTNSGSIRVTVASTGGDLDLDGYYLVVDAQQFVRLAANELFFRSFYLAPGTHAVTLQNVAENCVVPGSNQRTVSVETDLITDVSFDVECFATGIAVTTRTTGVDSPDSLQLSLAGRPPVSTPSSSSYTIGRLAAGSYVVAVTVPANCVVSGGAQVAVTVTLRAVTPVTFDVTCT